MNGLSRRETDDRVSARPLLPRSEGQTASRQVRWHRTVLGTFLLGPGLAGMGSILVLLHAGSASNAVALGIFVLALVWGFLGTISLLTAKGMESAEAVVQRRRAVRGAIATPQAGWLSSSSKDGHEGALAVPGRSTQPAYSDE